MENRRRAVIGIAAIALIALAIVALPGGGAARRLVDNSVQALFLALIAFSLVQLYRRQGTWLSGLPDRERGLVYGAVAVGLLAIVGVERFRELWDGGIVLLLVLLAGCVAVIYRVWRQSQDLAF
jgi:hypothetical protein